MIKCIKKPTLIDDVQKYLDLFPVGLVQFLTHNIKVTIESLSNKSLSEQECCQLCISLGNYLNMKIFENSKLFMDDKTY